MSKARCWSIACLMSIQLVYAQADWTILNYIEGNNNIGGYGLNNVKSMQKAGSTNKINIIVQLNEVHAKKTWRFQVAQGGIKNDASLAQPMGINPEKELYESVAWSHTAYPSAKFMLNLWNHGNGILDEPKGYSKPHRGILYDYAHHTYLNNQQMERVLHAIHYDILGKKIDLLGMDACLMAMIEICFQVQDHAEILVASENVEPAPGWDYATFLRHLTQSSTIVTPPQLATMIINSYKKFTAYRGNEFTLSAINLNDINAVVENLNHIIIAINQHAQNNRTLIKTIIHQARQQVMDFNESKYIDILSFYQQITKQLSLHPQNNWNTLQALLHTGEQYLKKAVFAFSGNRTKPPHVGLSIYYPRTHTIHPSYPLTQFAKKTLWLAFIQEYPAH